MNCLFIKIAIFYSKDFLFNQQQFLKKLNIFCNKFCHYVKRIQPKLTIITRERTKRARRFTKLHQFPSCLFLINSKMKISELQVFSRVRQNLSVKRSRIFTGEAKKKFSLPFRVSEHRKDKAWKGEKQVKTKPHFHQHSAKKSWKKKQKKLPKTWRFWDISPEETNKNARLRFMHKKFLCWSLLSHKKTRSISFKFKRTPGTLFSNFSIYFDMRVLCMISIKEMSFMCFLVFKKKSDRFLLQILPPLSTQIKYVLTTLIICFLGFNIIMMGNG